MIAAEKLGKIFLLGETEPVYQGVGDFLIDAVCHPFRQCVASLRPRREFGFGQQYLWALRDVSLSIGEGEVFAIVGPNGSGKSTLLKILSQVTIPTEGRFQVRAPFMSLLEVGVGFHPELTGRENIFLSGSILGMRQSEVVAKLDSIVAFSGVEDFLDLPLKFYFSGMVHRLGFSVASHLDVQILMLDESLVVGDKGFAEKAEKKSCRS